MTLVLLGIDSSLKYSDVSKILKHSYSYKVVSNISDWKYTMQGISATYNDEMKSGKMIPVADVAVIITVISIKKLCLIATSAVYLYSTVL